jgi:hypothetical protein
LGLNCNKSQTTTLLLTCVIILFAPNNFVLIFNQGTNLTPHTMHNPTPMPLKLLPMATHSRWNFLVLWNDFLPFFSLPFTSNFYFFLGGFD